LNSPKLLAWAAGRTAKTRASDVGELTLSMLRGEQGAQNREITELIAWLKTQASPEVICLSNALLIAWCAACTGNWARRSSACCKARNLFSMRCQTHFVAPSGVNWPSAPRKWTRGSPRADGRQKG